MELPLKELIGPIELALGTSIIVLGYFIHWLRKRRLKLMAINAEMCALNNQLRQETEEYRVAWKEFKTSIVDKAMRELRHAQYRPLAEIMQLQRELDDLINYIDNWSLYFQIHSSNINHQIKELDRQAKRLGA